MIASAGMGRIVMGTSSDCLRFETIPSIRDRFHVKMFMRRNYDTYDRSGEKKR